MPIFEFVLEGPPVSLNALFHTGSRKRYRRWEKTVKTQAQRAWPRNQQPTRNNAVVVVISCYYTALPPDVDNILKPICDAMKGIVYEDDKQIWKVVGQRFDLSMPIDDDSALLKSVSGILSEIVHVVATWETED